MAFTHLHVHSSNSLKDGIQKADTIGEVVASRGMTACALTDHGTLSGILDFVKGCRKANVKPIIGNETYLAFNKASEGDHPDFGNNGHFLCLAKNETGYKNLLKLNTYAFDTGFYRHPRIDLDKFKEHSEGLVVTSTCLSSHMATYFKRGELALAEKWFVEMLDIVGKDNFFAEVQANNVDIQRAYNDQLIIPLAKKYNVPLVLTADAHQSHQDQWKLRGLVQCIGWHMSFKDSLYPIQDYNAWMYDQAFALELCKSWNIPEEAVHNTGYVADMIQSDYFEKSIKAPALAFNGLSNDQAYYELRKLALQGLMDNLGVTNFKDIPKEYMDQLKFELDLIDDTGYCSYFLVVHDYIEIARDNDIPVGPGRGSSGGSLLAWCLGLTAKYMDPIKKQLYFSRFLNPGRVKVELKLQEDLNAISI
jgi:DNA polymerase-3 subunit alpha